MTTSFLSSFDAGAKKQRGITFCPLNFSTAKKVRLNIWGNTERKDAPYDVAEIKLIKLETTSCPREFIVKKCAGSTAQNNLWVDCPTAALNSSYAQCCSPLLAINSISGSGGVGQYVDRGNWQIGMTADWQSFFSLSIDCADGPDRLEAYAIHPGLTPECPKATVLGLGQDAGPGILGTCDVEITKFRRCPEEDRPVGNPNDWISRTEPLAVFQIKGTAKLHPDQIGYLDHSYRVCSKTIVWEIFCVEDALEFSAVADFPATADYNIFYAAGGKVYKKKAVYAPPAQYPAEQEYVLIGDYSPGVAQWYAAVTVICIPAAFRTTRPPGAQDVVVELGTYLLYHAPLNCGINGKPIGKIPPPPDAWASCALYSDEIGNTVVASEFEFPTMTLYTPGSGVPTTDGEKPPAITPAPEWCGIEQCKSEDCDCDNPKPFAALGVECGCDKNCLVNNVIARVGIAGSDDNIPCETLPHLMCRTFDVPAGNYYISFSTDTRDELHHTDMQHHFLVDWCDIDDDTLTCADSCSSSSSSSSSSSQTAQNLFDATSWAAVEEPYKTYLTNAAARWSARLAFAPARYAAIRAYYNDEWAGVTLNSLIKINDAATNMIASCQLVGAVSFDTAAPDSYAPTYFNMTVNEAFTGSAEFDATFWETVVAHELGHALGIGSLWIAANNALNGAAYTHAQAAYNNITAISRQYTPLESDGGTGTAGAHWENSYRAAPNNPSLPAGLNTDFNGVQNELMIGTITANPGGMVMSQLTIGALVDLGFVAVGSAESNPTTIGGAQLLTAPPIKFCGHDPMQMPTITVLPKPAAEQ